MKRLFLTVFLLFTLFLQGCVPAAFVAGATAGGVIIYDHRDAKTIVWDRDNTFKIQHLLDKNVKLREQAHVSVTTFNRIVLLVGQTQDTLLRKEAEMIAKSRPNIKMIYNEITIDKPISDMAKANDAWITTKVKTVLVSTPKLNSSTLKIVTENQVVYLMGLTTRSQAKLATAKVRTVAGVKKVVKLFEYLN